MPLQSPAVLERPVKNRTLKRVPSPVSVDFQYRVLPVPPCVPERVAVVPLYITARDYLPDRIVIGSDGDIIYPHIRNALLHGRKVVLSVKGVSVDGDFFKRAICRAYEEFPESTVDNDIEVTDMSKSEAIELEEERAISKSHNTSFPTYDDWVDALGQMLRDGYEGKIVSDDEIEPLEPDEDFARAITFDELRAGLREDRRERYKKLNE